MKYVPCLDSQYQCQFEYRLFMIKANLLTSACPFFCSRLFKRIWRAVCALHDTPIHVRNEIFFVIEEHYRSQVQPIVSWIT